MDISMPSSFPMPEYRAFGLATRSLFPQTLSDEDMNDPLHRRTHFDWAWQAIRYRFRSAAEFSDEFRMLVNHPSEMWVAGWGDEEFTYKLERSIYTFFMNGLSVFDSFAYALYFLGHAIEPAAFPNVAKPRKITREATAKAFRIVFPQEPISALLDGLSKDAKFGAVDELRNILGHRLSGRRSVSSSSTMHRDGTFTTVSSKETWHIPGASISLTFDQEMLQRVLDDIVTLVKALTAAALQFTESHQPTQAAA
jgi:hypothetical protein